FGNWRTVSMPMKFDLTGMPTEVEPQGDYSNSVGGMNAFKDPRVLQDLRDYYQEKGLGYLTDDELVDEFYKDRTWADLNTSGAIGDALEAHQVGENQRARMRRLENVWRSVPFFWQEGGRGAAALPDIAKAIILDPVNLIPGVAAYKAAATGARAAYLAGKNAAVARGAARGIGKGAAVEAGISAGQEAIVDTATQMRDIELGLQDEFSTGRLLGSTALGGAIGGTAGAAIGAIPGVLGARKAVDQTESLLQRGVPADDLAMMSQREFSDFANRTEDVEFLPAPEQAADEPAPVEELTPAEQTKRTILRRVEALGAKIEDNYDAASAAARDLPEGPERQAALEEMKELARLRNTAARLASQQEEVDNLLSSNDAKKLATGGKRSDDLIESVDKLERKLAGEPIAINEIEPRVEAEPAAARADADESPVDEAAEEVVEETVEETVEEVAEEVPPVRAAPISPKLKSYAISLGVDVSQVTGSGKNGRLLKKDIDAAVQRNENGEIIPQGTVATTNDEVLDILNKIAVLQERAGTEIDTQMLRDIARGFADEGDYKSNVDDLMSVIDGLFPSVERMSQVVLTTTERKTIRKIAQEQIKDNPNLSKEEATKKATDLVIARRSQGTPEPESLVPSSAQRVQDAKIWDGAGISAVTGRIQSMLRRGTPIGDGYTTTSAGLERGEAPRITRASMDAQEAFLESKGGIIEFKTSAALPRVFTSSGTREVPAGTTVFADGSAKRIYDTYDLALRARGIVTRAKKPDANVTQEGQSASVELGKAIRDLVGEKDYAALIRLADELDSKVNDAPISTPPSEISGNRVAILRKRGAEGNIRLTGKGQAQSSKPTLIKDILGSEDINNWEVRYVNADEARAATTSLAKRNLFEKGVPIENLEEAGEMRASMFVRGDRGDNLLEEPATITDLESPDFPGNKFTREDQAELADIASGLGISITALDNRFGKHTRDIIARYESMTWPTTGDGIERVIQNLQRLYALQNKYIPQGFIPNEQSRAASIAEVERLFNKYSPDETAAAVRLIERLGGDPAVGPVLNEGRGWAYISSGNEEGRIYINMAEAKTYVPKTYALAHEVAHWAYRNILTPEDRIEYWRAISKDKFYGSDGKLLPPDNVSGDTGFLPNHSPQEFFANEFASWTMRNGSFGNFSDQNFWKRIARYVKQTFDYIFGDRQIDNDMIGIFQKILPEAQRNKLKLGVDNPSTPREIAIFDHWERLSYTRQNIETALRSDNPEAIISAFQDARSVLAKAAPGRRLKDGRTNPGATFSVYRPLEKMIRGRFADVNEILHGKAMPEQVLDDNYNTAFWDIDAKTDYADEVFDGYSVYEVDLNSASMTSDVEKTAELLSDLYHNGHAGEFTPSIETGGGNIEFTSLAKLFEMMEGDLEGAYAKAGKTLNTTKQSIASAKKTKTARAASTREKTRSNAQVSNAVANAKTTRNRRVRTKTSEASPATAPSLKSVSFDDLKQLWSREQGSDRGDQISLEILTRMKQQPLPPKAVPVTRAVKDARADDLSRMLDEAFDANDKDMVDQIAYEMSRRNHNRSLPKTEKVRPTIKYRDTSAAIARETNDNVGVATSDGIPPSARAGVRAALSLLTHRDPEVQTTIRTMGYRMLNLMGKTTRGTLEDVNFMTTQDLARLAGATFDGESGSFADLRGPNFAKLRSDLRKLSIGLTKGTANPLDLMHEVTHMIVRSGILPDGEMEAVRAAFAASDDPIKKRISDAYTRKYADRQYSDAEMEGALAEEWMAESFAEYLAERVAKGDIAGAALLGRSDGIVLKNRFERAIDRLVEYVSYVLNGLIGRNDIKQTFRRITFSGNMFDNGTTPPLARRKAAVHPSQAAAYASDSAASATRIKDEKVRRFVGNGVGYDQSADAARPFYHATPVGFKFNRNANPDVVLQPSTNGYNGPGVYLADQAEVPLSVYGQRPTDQSIMRAISEADLPDDVREDLEIDAFNVTQTRREISKLRNKYAILRQSNANEENDVNGFLNAQDMREIKNQIDELVNEEMIAMENFARYNIASDPLSIPVYVGVKRTADFRADTFYNDEDPFAQTILDLITENPELDAKSVNALREDLAYGLTGSELYQSMIKALSGQTGRSDASRLMATEMLQQRGYDSIHTTHANTVDDVTDIDTLIDGRPVSATREQYDVLVVFDSENVKHVDAEYFDSDDARLFYADRANSIDRQLNGEMIQIAQEGNNLNEIRSDLIADTMEAAGASPPVADLMYSVARNRPLSVKEEQAARKLTAPAFLSSQSERFKRMGMNYIGDWYKDSFVETSQRLAKTLMPIMRDLRNLSDADGALRRWSRKSSAGLWQEQPKSYSKIVRALRRGTDSQQYKSLSSQERNIVDTIRKEFDSELQQMRESGAFVGYRKNYLPQVWSKENIQKNRDNFLQAMSRYYQIEKQSIGQTPNLKEATDFAERMYD
ncbi:MAG: hypothetical protein EBV86_04800, partial [Marivivens sp.]|nr:hypothetical protein [Marivivens sp.]